MPFIAVTGARGNVGREVVAACERAGMRVRACGRQGQTGLRTDVEEARLDLFDRRTWQSAVAGCDGLFLLRPPAVTDMQATLNPFIDFAYEMGVSHIVFVSVAGAERMAWVPHRKVELHLEALGGHATVLRPGFFAQNLQDAYRRDIVEDRRLYVGLGSAKIRAAISPRSATSKKATRPCPAGKHSIGRSATSLRASLATLGTCGVAEACLAVRLLCRRFCMWGCDLVMRSISSTP